MRRVQKAIVLGRSGALLESDLQVEEWEDELQCFDSLYRKPRGDRRTWESKDSGQHATAVIQIKSGGLTRSIVRWREEHWVSNVQLGRSKRKRDEAAYRHSQSAYESSETQARIEADHLRRVCSIVVAAPTSLACACAQKVKVDEPANRSISSFSPSPAVDWPTLQKLD